MHSQCQPASTSPFPSSSVLPSLLPGLPKAGLPSGLLSPEASPHLGCYKEIPWMCWRPGAPGQQDSALLRAAGVGWTREETCIELFLCQEALDLGPGISRAQPSVHVSLSVCLSVWAEGPYPSGVLPSPFLRGLLLVTKCWWRDPSFPTSRAEQDPFLSVAGERHPLPDMPQPQCSCTALLAGPIPSSLSASHLSSCFL